MHGDEIVIRVTKDLLRGIRIHNSYMLAQKAKSAAFITYAPATTGLGAVYAYWALNIVGYNCDVDSCIIQGFKRYTVTCREEKPIQLQKAMEWAREALHIDEWEKDPFGSYQVKGTIEMARGQNKSNTIRR